MCIVSRDPLRSGKLLLSIQASLNPDDEVQIIVDRRRDPAATTGQPAGDGDRPTIDRRRRYTDQALAANGFAIVAAVPTRRLSDEDADPDERELFDRILSFNRRRRARRWTLLVAPVALIVVLLILLPPVDSLLHQLLPEAPPSSGLTNGLPAVVQAPLVTGLPVTASSDPPRPLLGASYPETRKLEAAPSKSGDARRGSQIRAAVFRRGAGDRAEGHGVRNSTPREPRGEGAVESVQGP